MSIKTQVIITALAMIVGGGLGGVIGGPIMDKYLNQYEEYESVGLKNKVKELEVKLARIQTENIRLKTKVENLEKQPQRNTQEVSAELSRLQAENAILKQRAKDLEGYRQPIQAIIKQSGVTFELESCRLLSDSYGRYVHCTFFITNTGDSDTIVYLKPDSKIFDPAGREYTTRQINIGNTSDTGSYVMQALPAGVKTKAEVIFEVSSSTASESQIQLFRFVYSVGGFRDDSHTDFRNIPLLGEKNK